MAGARQPIELIQAKGKKHLTKDEINSRKKAEIQAPADKITPPKYLNKEQKTKFKIIAKQLKAIEIIANIDVDLLARYLISETKYLETGAKIDSEEVQSNIILLEKYVGMQDKYFKQCQSCAKELGLTVSSRCKIAVPKNEEKKPENKFSKFGVAGG